MLELNKPIYEKKAAYGHFGRAPEKDGAFSWEKADKTGVFFFFFLFIIKIFLIYCFLFFLLSKFALFYFFLEQTKLC
mgnify:CR=1 FL=1